MNAYSRFLVSDLFNDEEIDKLNMLCDKVAKSHSPALDLEEIWEYDQSLGGLGGYAMPSSPVINPFNTWGAERNLFRSVQYAKSSIVYNPTYPRSVIVDVGRSLEITCKYILDQKSILSRLQNKMMLGKNLDLLRRKGVINEELYDSCKLLASLTNIAKHEIDENNDRTFEIIDGLVAYFSLRKIHNSLLDIIGHDSRQIDYAIYTDTFNV